MMASFELYGLIMYRLDNLKEEFVILDKLMF